jgi:hypothetical protein
MDTTTQEETKQTTENLNVSDETHSEVGCNTRAGVVPPELEAIGRENSAALEELMKKIDG